MKISKLGILFCIAGFGAASAQDGPPRHEVGLLLGGALSGERSGGGTALTLGSGIAFQANYGYRVAGSRMVALYGEVHFWANPLREVASSNRTLTRDVATLMVTPGIRLKFRPGRAIAPYVAFGGGFADYEQSTLTLEDRPNPAPRTVNHGVFDYGGGVDVRFWRFVGLRAEVRDFYAGAPSYNAPALRGGQHTIVAGGGLVLRFR